MPSLLLTDLPLLLGRTHPLLVHLPIGFLLLAVLLEYWPGDHVRPAIRVAWVAGAAAALLAVGAGWLLAGSGDYGGAALRWHRWLGVAVAVVALAGCYLARNGGRTARLTGLLTVGLLGLAGHQGGNLTHGADYLLAPAPTAVQHAAGYQVPTPPDWSARNTDSLPLYATFLQPALERECTACHGPDEQYGALRLDHPHLALAGGKGHPFLTAGQPAQSEWFRRITLPRHHPRRMPPRGDGWSYTETRLLRYWIEEGADTLQVLDRARVPEELKALLLRDYDLDLSPRLYAETLRTPPVTEDDLSSLAAAGWSVTPLTPDRRALEVRVRPGATVDAAALENLASRVPAQVVYLALDNMPLDDAALAVLPRFTHLNRLRLNGTAATTVTVRRLATLPDLESLNLYATAVGDEVFAELRNFPVLQRLYLWQTAVSADAVRAFRTARPELAIDTGFSFTEPSR